jgi:Uma2 family endonuclease
MRATNHHQYTWKEYLAFERTSNVKHEFCDGEIFAMAGGTPSHAALGLAVGSELRFQLTGRDCRAYSSDLRIRVPATGLGTYPDATVICGKSVADPEDENTLVNPVVIVEVLSASTETYDRGEKFEHYRQLPSLRDYVLVSWREPLIEVFRRDDGSWKRVEARRHGAVRLESIDCSLEVDRVYAGVELS